MYVCTYISIFLLVSCFFFISFHFISFLGRRKQLLWSDKFMRGKMVPFLLPKGGISNIHINPFLFMREGIHRSLFLSLSEISSVFPIPIFP